jgi:hypothetical protein
MNWQINILYRDRADSLVDTFAAVGNQMDPVARQVVLSELGSLSRWRRSMPDDSPPAASISQPKRRLEQKL